MEPEPYISFISDANKTRATKQGRSLDQLKAAGNLILAPCPIHATIQDSGRYQGKKKPVPQGDNKYVVIFGFLKRVEHDRENDNAKMFHIDVESITFQGNAPIAPKTHTGPEGSS